MKPQQDSFYPPNWRIWTDTDPKYRRRLAVSPRSCQPGDAERRRRAAVEPYPKRVERPRRSGPRAPRVVERWESLSAGIQAAIAFPPLAALLFVVNLGPFHQPLGRAVVYGLIEAAPLTALLLVATAGERRKRVHTADQEPPDG